MTKAAHDPDSIRRVGIVFAGGPAPGANAVIGAAAYSVVDSGRQAIGFNNGYKHLSQYHPVTYRLREGEHYIELDEASLRGVRNRRGIILGTARTNPGKGIAKRTDLDDPDKTQMLAAVYSALIDLEIDALVSIGGDDTLKTANLLHEYQQRLPEGARRVRIIHLPKTIDNDYHGIDFTFGFFTAVDVMAKELQNLRADALATESYFIVETMGRKAGWLSYGVAIAGEAHMVVAREDVAGDLAQADSDGSNCLDLDALTERIVDLMLARERLGKHYGTVVLAEGLAEMLPHSLTDETPRDEHGHISLGRFDVGSLVADRVQRAYKARTGRSRKVKSVQLGYEARCAPPHAFDVMLGSQLGIGAFRALIEEGLDGHMVSVTGQLDLQYVPFAKLVDATTLLTTVRFIEPGSDFHRLARFLESRVDR